MPGLRPSPAPAPRTQSVAPRRRRDARAAQAVAFPGRADPESAYNLAGTARGPLAAPARP
jgi:hypothetical protein